MKHSYYIISQDVHIALRHHDGLVACKRLHQKYISRFERHARRSCAPQVMEVQILYVGAFKRVVPSASNRLLKYSLRSRSAVEHIVDF